MDRNTEKEVLPQGEQVQFLQPWVTGLWLGRDTLSDEHLIGTAAGVMRSGAARRLQEPATWVPAALKAMLFAPWSPHLNLPGRPRLQRPAYEEPVEAGALPRFIEIPTAPTTRNPKSETFVTTPSDAEQSTKRQRQEVIPRESQHASSSSCAATDTSMQIPDPQTPKPARPLSQAEREDRIPKTSETSRGEHSVNNCRGLQRKRYRNTDG